MESRKIEGLWSHVHWLAILAEQGSYTRAATRLGVSKAAMSQRIAELERATGTALVQRTTRSVRLTEAGQRLVDDTRQHYELIAEAFSAVRDQAGTVRGLLRVTAPVALARQQLVKRLPAFLAANPEVRVQVDLSDRLTSLTTEGFDLAIRHSAEAPDTHVAIRLCETRSVLVATGAYLRKHGAPEAPDALAAHHCLVYPRVGGDAIWSFERRGRKGVPERVTVKVAGPFAANNSEALRDAAAEGLGITLLPDFSAQALVRAGTLVQVLPEWKPTGAFADQLYVIRPYSPHVPLAVGAFVAYLREAFAQGFPLQGPGAPESRRA